MRTDHEDRVIEIVDKPRQTDLEEMWGCIIWRSAFTEFLNDAVRRQCISDFARIMNDAILSGMQFRGVHITDGTYIDLGTYEEIKELDQKYREE